MLRSLVSTLWQMAIIFAVIYGLLVLVTDNLPDPPANDFTCSCVGKGPDCELATFDIDGTGERLAQCALWGDRSVCCHVPSK